MTRPTRRAAFVVFLLPVFAFAAPVPKEKPKQPIRSERVDKLFGDMRGDAYSGAEFPDFKLEDIPALLELADSTRELTRFPVNPLSSAVPAKVTSEGMVALWLAEGVRLGGKFPSLNTPHGEELKAQAELVKAYRAWWAKVKDTPDEIQKTDPLVGSNLHWSLLLNRK